MFNLPRHHRRVWLMLFSGLLVACAPSTVQRTPQAAPTQTVDAGTAAPSATVTTPPTPTTVLPTSVPQPGEQDLAQLEALIRNHFKADQLISPDRPIEVGVLPLTLTEGRSPVYAAYTIGPLPGLDPEGRHVLALYSFAGGNWHELQLVRIENAEYIDRGGIQQVSIEPTHIWLEVQSGAGAHSGCYDLIAFDPIGQSVSQHISSCNSSPGAGYTADIDGDGQLDVVLDQTDYYVFCYACGLRYFKFKVLSWDGAHLSEQILQSIPDTVSPAARENGDRAVRLAQAGLWKEAVAAADAGGLSNSTDPVIRWNGALIQLHADAFKQQAAEAPANTLLPNLFYGDYDAVLDVLRPHQPADLFNRDTPLIKGTLIEDWEEVLINWITTTTTSAIAAQPDLAATYFLRGWATYLQDPGSPLALDDVERAAQLEPNEPLYTQSVVYLKQLP
jgi:hypothetical protein